MLGPYLVPAWSLPFRQLPKQRQQNTRLTRRSRHQLPIHRLNHLPQLRAKQLVHFAKAAFAVEGCVFKVVGLYAQIRSDVVSDPASRLATRVELLGP